MRTLAFVAAPCMGWVSLSAGSASAHALAQRYDLPLPLGLYLVGAGAAVALSFVALLALKGSVATHYRKFPLGYFMMRSTAVDWLLILIRFACVLLLLLVIAAGIFGRQDPLKNIAPVTVWVIFWVGLAFFCALIGNAWRLINPWATLHDVGSALLGRSDPAQEGPFRYPSGLGIWPATFLLLVLLWMELVWDGAEHPRSLAAAIILYSAATLTGISLFGRDAWLRNAEVFSVLFSVLGRFAPISDGLDRDPVLALRPYAVGLLAAQPVSWSLMAFVIVLLSAVTFDGLLETPLWVGLSDTLLVNGSLQPVWSMVEALGIAPYKALVSVALMVFPVGFLAVYWVTCWGMGALACRGLPKKRAPTGELARLFVLTLVPIAIGYHFAHYLSYLLLAGQFAIPLVSDPFGFGWDLFGTGLYRIDIGIIDAATTWRVSVIAVVLGHVAAVYLAHATAIRVFGDRRVVRRSQLPMLALMVAYTMTSLWILAQPIVE